MIAIPDNTMGFHFCKYSPDVVSGIKGLEIEYWFMCEASYFQVEK